MEQTNTGTTPKLEKKLIDISIFIDPPDHFTLAGYIAYLEEFMEEHPNASISNEGVYDEIRYVINSDRFETDEELAKRQKRADQKAFRKLNPTEKELARRIKKQQERIEKEKQERALLAKLKDKYESKEAS